MRRIVGSITLTLDGRVNGPGGDQDMAWVVPHAFSDEVRDHLTALHRPATTALLGRKNYVGYREVWPSVAVDDTADPRDRGFAQWLDAVEKVVVSRSLTDPGWTNARVVDETPGAIAAKLREQEGGDILVLASGSVLRDLLDADMLDRLAVVLVPEILGGGATLFPEPLPPSHWTLTSTSTSATGALCLLYDRTR